MRAEAHSRPRDRSGHRRSAKLPSTCADLTPSGLIYCEGGLPAQGARDRGPVQQNGWAMADVGIIMGSKSDWETMRHAADMLDALGVPHETKVVSAHRTPDRLYDYAKKAA